MSRSFEGHEWTPEETARVEDNLGLVGFVLGRTRYCQHLDRDEREAIGRVGLVKAALRFDPARGVKFCTYAYPVIYRELQSHHLEDRPIRIPHYLGTRAGSESRHVAAAGKALGCVSLEAAGRDLAVDDASDEWGDLIDSLRGTLPSLPERERLVIDLRFFQGETLAVIGARLGVTKEWIRQIEVAALLRLRRRLGATDPAPMPAPPAAEKPCADCKAVKPHGDYYSRTRRGRQELESYCRDCSCRRGRESRARLREKARAACAAE